jgi:hypothetical protein
MRASEFITEAKRGKLSRDDSGPMRDTFFLPGIRNNDAYKTYRLSMAFARARADNGGYGADLPAWNEQGALGPYAVVSVLGQAGEDLIDQGLAMIGVPGGKVNVGGHNSTEPTEVNTASPVKGFKGYGQ